ncbi:MAG: molybdopterin biosynthesis protein [Bacillota bacterium]|nr:molybdopterin biosynthesis protein [Bacillota bacterium]
MESPSERQIYLTEVPWEEALLQLRTALRQAGWPPEAVEEVPAWEALGRVTAEPVVARLSSPHYHAAAMDGLAVRAADTFGASETNPVVLPPERAVPVNTGQPLPPGCDAVIRIEEVQPVAGGYEILAAVAPWQDVRPIGEDIIRAEMILPSNHVVRPQDVGALLAGGVLSVRVRRRPRVAIIPSGDEVVDLAARLAQLPGLPPDAALRPGEVVEYNSHVLAGLIQEWGGEAERRPVVRDDEALLRRAIEEALEKADVVVLNAGSSAGTRDYAARSIAALGRVLVHGVATRPGKPVVLGIAEGKPVLGLPGYPVSAYLAAQLFLQPLLGDFLHRTFPSPPRVRAFCTRRIPSPPGVEEFVRVRVGRVRDRLLASPISRGAGVITSLVNADGVLRIPRGSQGLAAGAEVEVELSRPREEIERTVLLSGSDDLILDLLADELRLRFPGWDLAVAPVGSLGGLAALKRGEAHLASAHLLDEETGEYNFPFIRRVLPDLPVVVVNLAYRQQGLIVRPGNPLGISTFADLTRPEVTFINRQKGAGTRILLDIELARQGIDPKQIRGYEREEYTHMAVAAAVASGSADAGLGLYSAARALGLDFVLVGEERYDLIVPRDLWETEPIALLLEVIRSPRFQERVRALGGYDTRQTGQVLEEKDKSRGGKEQ